MRFRGELASLGIAVASLLATRVDACECPSPIGAFERADTIVVARIVETARPPQRAGDDDALERSEVLRGRAVVIDTLRGKGPASVALSMSPGAGMCNVATRLAVDDVIVLPLETGQVQFKVRYCTSLLLFGRHWRDWDDATRDIRDLLRVAGDYDSAIFYRVTDPFLWLPVPPPPPPPQSREGTAPAKL